MEPVKLSEYAKQHGIVYRTAWNRFKNGKIPGAYIDDSGHIVVPSEQQNLKNKCAIYARVSTHKQKGDLDRQATRLKEFATARGLEVTEVVTEVGSGVNDNRAKLTNLLSRPTWGVLLVEHRDRLTRAGFGWFDTLLSMTDREVVVADSSEESDEGRLEDIMSLLYAYAASEYGKRGAKNRVEKARKAVEE